MPIFRDRQSVYFSLPDKRETESLGWVSGVFSDAKTRRKEGREGNGMCLLPSQFLLNTRLIILWSITHNREATSGGHLIFNPLVPFKHSFFLFRFLPSLFFVQSDQVSLKHPFSHASVKHGKRRDEDTFRSIPSHAFYPLLTLTLIKTWYTDFLRRGEGNQIPHRDPLFSLKMMLRFWEILFPPDTTFTCEREKRERGMPLSLFQRPNLHPCFRGNSESRGRGKDISLLLRRQVLSEGVKWWKKESR